MTRIAVVQFTSGEVTPEVDVRPDIESYAGGCRKLENMLADLYGNATKRPGTELIVAGNGAACYYEGPIPDPTKIGISTMEDLAKIGNEGSHPLNGDYELLNNIDATGFDFEPIGDTSNAFTGSFDGNFLTISNIELALPGVFGGSGGFFFKLSAATIENLTLKDMAMTNVGDGGAGLLAVQSLGASVVTNVHVSGSISGTFLNLVGGMFSTANPNMSICSADVIMTSARSTFTASGLSRFFGGNMINCYARGSIISTSGGNALNNTGGLIGVHGGSGTQTVVNCYSAMIITGSIFAPIPFVGGLSGADAGAVTFNYTSNYWDDDIIPVLDLDDIGNDGDVAGVLKSNTSAMFQEATFVDWDFTDIWMIDEGNDYPRFIWQTQADIRQICQRVE